MYLLLAIALAAAPDLLTGCEIVTDAGVRAVRCKSGTVATRENLSGWLKRQLAEAGAARLDAGHLPYQLELAGQTLSGTRFSTARESGFVVQATLQQQPASVSCRARTEAALSDECPALVELLLRPAEPFAPFTTSALGFEPLLPSGCRRLDGASIDCDSGTLRWGRLTVKGVETLLDRQRPTLAGWQLETYERRCVAGGRRTTCFQLHQQSGDRVRNLVIAATGPSRAYFVECRVSEELPAEGPAPSVCAQAFTFER
ncbi:MAG: hypothetical protein IPJ65_26500 [Archangiaceae bacterium]|nr:hypothetical protein [Archangiaceae bacterium]